MTFKVNTIPPKRLATTIDASATTFQLSDILGFDGLTNLSAAIVGDTMYGSFQNTSGTIIEIFKVDTSTIASASITMSKRGLQFNEDGTETEVTANKRLWVKNQTIVNLGTNLPQLFYYFKTYIDGIAIAGSPNASTTAKGIVEEATQAEVDAGTAAGSTGAELFINPATLRAGNYNDYVADTGAANAYVITPVPAITAYATGQIFTFKAVNANTTTSTLNVSALGVKTIKKKGNTNLDSSDIYAGQIVTVAYDGTNFQLISAVTPLAKFGGTGADGALAITSGTTTIDCANAAVVVKNYTSISITSTGKLAFSNPNANGTIIILKSQGNVTLTSSTAPCIDCSSLGSAAGSTSRSNVGIVGNFGAAAVTGTGGAGGAATGLVTSGTRFINLYTGAGGGAGSAGNSSSYDGSGGGGGANFGTSGSGGTNSAGNSPGTGTPGTGGRGGGALYLECAGAYSASGTLSTAGAVGVAATGAAAGGGGGGAGGSLVVKYNSLTSDTGTYTTTGGAGGAKTGFAGAGGAGANGYSEVTANNDFL